MLIEQWCHVGTAPCCNFFSDKKLTHPPRVLIKINYPANLNTLWQPQAEAASSSDDTKTKPKTPAKEQPPQSSSRKPRTNMKTPTTMDQSDTTRGEENDSMRTHFDD